MGGTNVSLTDRGDTQRSRFSTEPALSFVPLARRAAERLLSDHRTGRLVVDVEVAGREPQHLHRLDDGLAVLCDDRAGQAVWGDVGSLPDHPVVVGVVVDEHPEEWPEVLGREDLVRRVVGLHMVGRMK